MTIMLKLAMRPFRLTPWSQLSSALTAVVLLVLSGFLFWLEQGLAPVIRHLQKEQVITAYLSPQLEKTAESRLVDSIKTSLGSSAEVRRVGSQEFIAAVKPHYPELSRELESLGEEANHLIPRYVSISGVFEDQTVQAIRGMFGVESIETSKDRYQNIVGAFQALRWVSRLMIAGLGLALLTGLVHLVRTNRSVQVEAMTLLRLWGANEWMIRLPSILSACWVGVLGGVVSGVIWHFFGAQIAAQIKSLSPMLGAMPLPHFYTEWLLGFFGTFLGLISGILASGATGNSTR